MSDFRPKDLRILKMLEQLQQAMGAGAFDIVDHWGDDPCAIGVASPRNDQVLLYIAVDDDGYFAERELPPATGSNLPYRGVGWSEGLTFDQLAVLVADHLAEAGSESDSL